MVTQQAIHWRRTLARTACGLAVHDPTVRSKPAIAFVTCRTCARDRWFFTVPNVEGLSFIGRDCDRLYTYTVRRSRYHARAFGARAAEERQRAIAWRIVCRLNARLDTVSA